MKTWTRARHTRRCGLCGSELHAGDPIAVYVVGGRRPIQLIRCGPCEGGAPPDLPSVIELDQTPKPALDFTRIGLLPLDWNPRLVDCEREPGEEG